MAISLDWDLLISVIDECYNISPSARPTSVWCYNLKITIPQSDSMRTKLINPRKSTQLIDQKYPKTRLIRTEVSLRLIVNQHVSGITYNINPRISAIHDIPWIRKKIMQSYQLKDLIFQVNSINSCILPYVGGFLSCKSDI